MKKIVVGITGATGIIYGVRILEILNKLPNIETILIMSEWAKKNLELETEYDLEYLKSISNIFFENNNLAASISSGSYKTNGMIIVPCSMKTLSSIANGYDDNLISRSANVTIKENRKLIICPRETPLSTIHLENMLKLSKIGVNIVPPMPAFYNKPESINDIVDHFAMRVLDQLEIDCAKAKRWS